MVELLSVLRHPVTLYIPLWLTWLCFIISVGDPSRFIDYDWLWFLFRNVSPYFWAAMGVALAIGLSVLGAAWWVGGGMGG